MLKEVQERGNRKRSKCAGERRKPVCEQHGAVQYKSRGGLAVQVHSHGD